MENKKYYKQKINKLQSKHHADQYNALLKNDIPGIRIIAINLYKILLADLNTKTLISWTEGDLHTEKLTEKNIGLQLNHYRIQEVTLHKKIGVGRF